MTKEIFQLQADEKVLLKFRRHWLMLVFDASATLLAGLAPFVLFAFLASVGYVPQALLTPGIVAFVSAWWLLVVWCALMVIWTDYYLDMWIVTDKRIISINQIELFNRTLSTWSINHVQEVTILVENMVQTFMRYGTIRIQTAGPTDEFAHIEGIPSPERVRNVILEAAARFHGGDPEEKKLLHAVSHEVKSYLTKDAAALASIAQGDFGAVPREVKQLAESALSETRKGVSAVMSMLDHSGVPESGSKFDLKPVLQALVAQYKAMAEEKGLSFEAELGSGVFQVRGDEVKLRDLVLRNLLENAVRYTLKGTVKVSLDRSGNMLRIRVEDSGIGITAADMSRLFTEGGHGIESRTVNPESTGYGLAAAKSVVEKIDGKIWAESSGKGLGSRFFVELPFA